MELVYCYIKNFNSLKNCEINWGWKYRFSYFENENILKLLKDDDYIENFLPTSVSNVSVIVGENGAGKSSVVEFLIKNIVSGNAIGNPEAIIITYNKKEEKLYIYLGPKINDSLKIEREGKIEYTIVRDLRHKIASSELIYYTNSFYDRIYDTDIEGMLNISLKPLLFGKNYEEYNGTSYNLLQEFRFKEFWKILRLMQSNIKFGIELDLPKYLVLVNNNKDFSHSFEKFIEKVKNRNNIKNFEYIEDFIVHIEEYHKNFMNSDTDKFKKFIYNLKTSFFLEYISQNFDSLNFAEIKNLTNETILSDKFFEYLIKDKEYGQSVIELFSDIERLVSNHSNYYDENNAWISTENADPNELKYFVNLLKKSFRWNSNFLSIGFSFETSKINELSSGEMAILTMLARFYALSKDEQYFVNLVVDKHAIIIIDEGELYLHPSWQKKLINILLTTLPIIFSDIDIQIVLTSHSPFVLSDLPKSKIIFLEKIIKSVSSSELLEHKQTFGSNIHTLLSDAFFLNDGFIGDYAKKIIDKVIKDLNSSNEIEVNRREEIKKIIMAIGEPIIKRKLLEMYESKFNLDIDDRVGKIEKFLKL